MVLVSSCGRVAGWGCGMGDGWTGGRSLDGRPQPGRRSLGGSEGSRTLAQK
ncbi:MAG: hypothetical protein FWF30_04360 [Coriobacteriia bacterium]|nr:hypothetical protein [Coriobacteriia bacterium]